MISRWRFAWAWSIGAVLAFGLGCPPKPPVPVDVCPNLEGVQLSIPDGYELVNGQCVPVAGPRFTDMLLRKCEGSKFCAAAGSSGELKPIDFAGCIACCVSEPELNPGWPLFSNAFFDYCQKQGRSNFFHMRPGPFLQSNEEDVAEIGGTYQETNGKADLTKWNEKYWTFISDRIRYAGEHGAWVEVDLIDSWRLKGTCDPSPWNARFNVQGEDHCVTTHRGPGDGVADAYLKKLVEATGRYGNVIYQIGNESANVAGKNAGLVKWERWVFDRVRAYEQEVGFGVVHMIGTNSGFDEIEASFPDYIVHHNVVFAPLYNKPTLCNEVNPAPDDYVYDYCRARDGGAYLWIWRDGLPKDKWDAALSGTSNARLNGCPGPIQPTVADCPKPLAAGAHVEMRNKMYGGGLDSTPWVVGDPQFCKLIHGVLMNECHLEGWPTAWQCEVFLNKGCPVWQWFDPSRGVAVPCLQEGGDITCDNFGNPATRDDPSTPIFEGNPAICGQQRDAAGHPKAGYFTVAHGAGQVQACRPDYGGCGPWVGVNHLTPPGTYEVIE